MKAIHPFCISLTLAIAVAQDFEQGYEPPVQQEDAAFTEEQTPDETEEEISTEDPSEEPSADEPLTDNAVEEIADETQDADAPQDTPSETDSKEAEPAVAEEVVELLEEQPAPPEPGMAVRVERIQGEHAAVDPSTVKLRAPFPAKLLAQVPQGWRIEKSGDAPAFKREVEIAPGSKIELSVQPHVLVPEVDGATAFSVGEPGYDAGLGYQQNATVGAILSSSIGQLEDDSIRLGNAIDQLQQLLVSLPRPEPALQDQPATNRKR